MPFSEPIPSELAWLIQRELNLNQEVVMLRTENAERREKLRKMLESETAADKIGLTRMPFSMKKLPSEQLRDKISEMSNEIREKIRQWQSLKGEIERKIEAYLLENHEDFAKACQAFGIIAESRAILVNLRNRIADYLSRTGQVRGSMAAGYNTATQTFSKQALETIRGAIESGYAADGIILKIQERETQFGNLVAGTFAKTISLPEFYTHSLGDFTESLRNMPLEAGHQAVLKAVSNCDNLLKNDLPAYEQALSQAEDDVRRVCLAQIEGFWQDIRNQVWTQLHAIKPMPQSARMTTSPFPQAEAATAVAETPNRTTEADEVKATSKPRQPGTDSGRGLSGDYFEKPAERRSRLKLRTPN